MNLMPLILIGGGGHAMSVASALAHRSVAGYVDLQPADTMHWQYLGNDDSFLASPVAGSPIITLVSGRNCSMTHRRRLIERYDHLITEWFASPSAEVDPSAQIGCGSVMMRRSVVNCNTTIGRHCVINTAAVVEHDCRIGNNVFIGPGAVICGGVTIGNDVYVGANATVRPGVRVASGAIIGLGAAVISDIVRDGVYVGVPAKRLNDE